jgi:RimJ/RimL family protein N-acetyltransferase
MSGKHAALRYRLGARRAGVQRRSLIVPSRPAPDRLTGEVVSLREVVSSDAPALFELLADPRVAAHMSMPPPSVDAFEGFIAWARAERAAGRGFCYGIVPHGLEDAVGIIQYRTIEPASGVAELGFAIGAAFWSTGVFVEAAHLFVRYAFETLGTHRLEARVTPANGRGNGVLQKLGANVEAVLSRSFARDGKFAEQFLWSLTAESWQQRTLAAASFSPADAKSRIAEAITETQEILRTAKPAASATDAPLYPFFVSQPGTLSK